MMSDCSSMRMQSTSCCFSSAAAPTRRFNSAADMACSFEDPYQLTSLRTWLRQRSQARMPAVWLTASESRPSSESSAAIGAPPLSAVVQCWMRALTSVYTARNTAVCSVGPHATLPCARIRATFFLPMTAARATPLGALLTSMSVAPNFLWMSNTGTPSAMKATLKHRLHRHADQPERDHRGRMAVDDRLNIGPRLVDLAVDESLEETGAAPGIAGIALQIVLDDVSGRHQRRGDRARQQIALGRPRVAHRDVSEGVDDALGDEDAAGRCQVRDQFGRDRAARCGCVAAHAFSVPSFKKSPCSSGPTWGSSGTRDANDSGTARRYRFDRSPDA